MKKYNPQQIEKKWQKFWEDDQTFVAKDKSDKSKKYVLIEIPYPSGERLHMGHLRPYVAGDVYTRYHRLQGFETMYPMGWDGFGLPAENFALKQGVHPSVSTSKNIANAKNQVNTWGISFDWSREIDTTDPKFYKWTQWIFLQFYKAGLAYQATGLINWCPKDKTGLANEEVIDGRCERCGSLVEKKEMKQWYLKITAYAEKLLDGLKTLNKWPEAVKLQQENWIGKSQGATIEFPLNVNYNYVILHGYKSDATENFYPWLKLELERRGFKVQAPTMPMEDQDHPQKRLDYVLKNVTFDQNTVIIGHSLGSVIAMKVVEQLNHPVAGLITVAGFAEPKFKDKERAFAANYDWQFDWQKIQDNTTFVEILHDLNDHIVPLEQARILTDKLKGNLVEVTAKKSHFGHEQEPEVLKYALADITVFTTRSDTMFGVTYIVLAPEHPLVNQLRDKIDNWQEVNKYIEQARSKPDLERTAEGKDKTGVELKGLKAINPATKEEIPVWAADYVLATYGTGAVMAVPAHDQRDYEFARKYDLPIRHVIAAETGIKRTNEERRDGGCGVIFDPKAQKYAVARYVDGMYRLYAGGVEDGEDLRQGILREITEESGLHDFQNVEVIGSAFAHFHNVRKKVNRIAEATCLLVVLNSTDTKPTNQEDHEKFELAWLTPEEILDNWSANNREHDLDHWIEFLNQAVGRAIELGYDRTSNPDLYKNSAYTGEGVVINSGKFTGLGSEQARSQMATEYGQSTVQYKLRDWVFSRQRYWGEPIPIIHCPKCGIVPVPEDQLPVELPQVEKYEPTGTGESPLAAIDDWVNVTCPQCGGPAKRETNTMPQWAGSSWYYLRYADPHNDKEFAAQDLQKHWLPVDVYFGGMEHTTLHLLYSRFWHLFLYDQGLVPTPEPYTQRVPHGIVLGPDGEKMSKSRGNVVNPDDIVQSYGADTLRMYELFLGPHEATVSWNDKGIIGVKRFLDRIWTWVHQNKDSAKNSDAVARQLNKLIKKITADIEAHRFNTAIAAFMQFHNEIKDETIDRDSLIIFLQLFYPFAPHISEELYQLLGGQGSLQLTAWPKFDATQMTDETVEVVIQINGKMRDKLRVPAGLNEEELKQQALATAKITTALAGKQPQRVIVIPDRLVNIVLE